MRDLENKVNLKSKRLIDSDNYYVMHLSDEHIKSLYSFTVNKEDAVGLSYYLQNQTVHEEEEYLARTYIVRDKASNEIAGYFSLRAGFIPWQIPHSRNFDSLPGVELAAVAVNETFRRKSKVQGLGTLMFHEFIVPLARKAAEYIGIKTLYLFALPDERLINHYKKWGFVRLKPRHELFVHRHIKPKFDKSCIFMYQNLFPA